MKKYYTENSVAKNKLFVRRQSMPPFYNFNIRNIYIQKKN